MQRLHNGVECAVCLSTFSDPCTLSCGHNFCRACLRGITDRGNNNNNNSNSRVIQCPSCRAKTPLPASGVEGLKTNYDLLAVIEALEGMKHGGEPASTEPSAHCPKHPREDLALFCESDGCKRLICRDCALSEHRQHSFDFVEQVAAKKRAEVAARAAEAQATLDKLRADARQAESNIQRVGEDAEAARAAIRAHSARLREAVQQREDELIGEVNGQQERLTTQLRREHEQLGSLEQRATLALQRAGAITVPLTSSSSSSLTSSTAQATMSDESLLQVFEQTVSELQDIAVLSWPCTSFDTSGNRNRTTQEMSASAILWVQFAPTDATARAIALAGSIGVANTSTSQTVGATRVHRQQQWDYTQAGAMLRMYGTQSHAPSAQNNMARGNLPLNSYTMNPYSDQQQMMMAHQQAMMMGGMYGMQ